MSPEELARGYAWLYQRTFSHRSIWARRPSDRRAVPGYLAMSYLYKRNNTFWQFLIANNLTQVVWRPLVEWSRFRHQRLRRELLARGAAPTRESRPLRALSVVHPSV
jgi:hypothetical protein